MSNLNSNSKSLLAVLVIVSLLFSFSASGKTADSFGLPVNVDDLLIQHKLNGLSLVIFDDFKVVYSNQWGKKAANSAQSIDENTAFSTASIAKPMVALVCAMLEEQGIIDLDKPIAPFLKRWKLPKSQYDGTDNVTWSHLLSHMGGTSQGGFADFYEGDEIPTIVQSLQGELLPRYDKPIEFLSEPGSSWRYSGGGYVIIQMALEDRLEKPLSQIMKQYLVDPMGLKNSTFHQPNEEGFLNNVAKVHDSNGQVIRTGLPITPQVAPSGFWSTPNDLAKIAIEVQKALGGHESVISQKVAKRVTDIVTINGFAGWARGFSRNKGYGNIDWFSHDGSNTGVGGDLMASMSGGFGYVIFANGDKPNRFPVIEIVTDALLKKMNWALDIDKRQDMPQEYLNTLVGSYNDFLYRPSFTTEIFEENGSLYVKSVGLQHFFGLSKSELVYLGNDVFKVVDYPHLLKFKFDQSQPISVTVFSENSDVKSETFELKTAN